MVYYDYILSILIPSKMRRRLRVTPLLDEYR